MNEPRRPIDSLKKLIAIKGDTDAYMEMKTAYMDYPSEDFFFWAMIMANKYDYSPAYYDVYLSLHYTFQDSSFYSINGMDEKTRKLALEYLNVAASRDVYDAKEELDSVKVYMQR